MATILIVDESPVNRDPLRAVLIKRGDRVLEAADGAEALEIVRLHRPDLVIADMLMAIIDGYEFVRRLRAEPHLAETRVVFWTAHYHEPEARTLARSCGVRTILVRPSDPVSILQVVEAELGPGPSLAISEQDPLAPSSLRELSDQLASRTDQLTRANERLQALIDLGVRLGSELDTNKLFHDFCDAARHIIGAREAMVGLIDDEGSRLREFFTSGMSAQSASALGTPNPRDGIIGQVLSEQRCRRVSNPSGDPANLGFSAVRPAIYSWLGAPITSSSGVHGWIGLIDRVGLDEFTDEDERLIGSLAAQVGRVYQNGRLFHDVQRHAVQLEREMAERRSAEALVRVQQSALDAAANGIGITDEKGEYIWVNPAYTRLTGYSREEVRGKNPRILKSGQHDPDFYRRMWETIVAGKVWHGELINRRKDGELYVEEKTIAPVRDEDGRVTHFISINQDVTERRQAEIERTQRVHFHKMNAELGMTLINQDGIDEMLGSCVEILARSLDAALVRIWTLRDDARVLELRASSERSQHRGEPLTRVPIGQLTIGQIARTREPYLTNDVGNDPIVDREWSRREGVTAFAGYPLLVGDHAVGVMALFSRQELGDLTREALEIAAKEIALGIDRKRTEIERDSLVAQLRTQIERMPLAYMLVDSEGNIVEWNRSAVRIFGFEREEMLGVGPPYEKIAPRVIHERIHQLERRLRSGDMTANSINENVTKDGRTIICEWSNTPLLGRDGRFIGAVCLAQDITSRMRAEKQLHEYRRKLEHVLASSPAVIYSLAVQGDDLVPTWLSENVRDVTGYAPEDYYGSSLWLDEVHPDDRERVREAIRRELLTTGRASVEFRLHCRDDRYIWIRTETRLVQDDNNGLEAIGSLSDITERKHVADQLHEAQQRLKRVVESSPAVLFTLEIRPDDFPPTWVSDNIKTLTGYDVAEVLRPEWWHTNIHPDDHHRVAAMVRDDIRDHGRAEGEFRFRHQNGTYRWVRSQMRLMKGGEGGRDEIVGSWSDITDRKTLEEQYRQAQKMEAVGKLAGGVAHDFNNILTVILGYSDVYLNQLRPEDPLRMPLTEIHRAGERAVGLTRQLLAFSRKQVLQPVVLDLNAVLDDVEKMLHRLIGEDIVLTVLRSPNLWPVKADAGQVEQVIMNIVINARDAMPRGGKLLIETKNVRLDPSYLRSHSQATTGDHVMLAISDTGFGMSPETKSRLFEPFYTTKGPGKGTGLGLATVFGIVKQSGGHVEVYSEIDRGTTFKIYLPRDRSGEPAVSVGVPKEPVRGGKETILLVEDEEGVRALAKAVLSQKGYHVIEARNSGDAILFSERSDAAIDLLITDVVMPLVSGRELAERLTQKQPSMKVLFMSGYTDDAIVHHGVLASGTPFLQKPFTPDGLARKVRDVLDASGP